MNQESMHQTQNKNHEPMPLVKQLRGNSLVMISLLVALASLFYNTWRNELTEQNRNVRSAGFEMILAIGELQQIVFFSHYDQDDVRGNPRAGWTRILLINDLSELMPAPVPATADDLLKTWEANWSSLGHENSAETEISQAINALRMETKKTLARLE